MTWYNPKTWFQKPSTDSVYLAVTLDGPIAGVSHDQPRRPWIRVDGLSLQEAVKQIPRINWHTLPLYMRQELELGDQCMSISAADAKLFLEGW